MIQLDIRSRSRTKKRLRLPVLLGIRLWLHPKSSGSLRLRLRLRIRKLRLLTAQRWDEIVKHPKSQILCLRTKSNQHAANQNLYLFERFEGPVSTPEAVTFRGLVMPGATVWLETLPNSSVEQWCMVVIVTGYTLFVTSQYDVIFRLATNVLAKFVDTTTCIFK